MNTEVPASQEQQPPEWFQKKLKERKPDSPLKTPEFSYRGNTLTLWDRDYPEMRLKFQVAGKDDDVPKFDWDFHHFENDLTSHKNEISRLTKRFGYTVSRVPDASPTELVLTNSQLESSEGHRVHRIEDNEGLRDFLLAAKEVVAKKSFAAAFSAAERGEEVAPVSPFAERGSARVRSPEPDVPEDKKVSLIFADESGLKRLASSRNASGRTWLDLLYATADSAAVNAVFIPSYLADIKLLGRTNGHSENGYNPVRFDNDYENTTPSKPYTRHVDAWREISNNASRLHIDRNGQTTFTPGKERKIIIFDGPADLEISQTIEAAKNGKLGLMNFEARAGKRPVAEMLAEDFATAAPIKGPAYIVTNNQDWRTQRNQTQTTKAGEAIGHATLSGYISAELLTRRSKVYESLESRGIPVHGELTLKRVQRSIMDAFGIKEGEYRDDPAVIVPGLKRQYGGSSIPGEDLRSLLLRGATQDRQNNLAERASTGFRPVEQPVPPSRPLYSGRAQSIFTGENDPASTESAPASQPPSSVAPVKTPPSPPAETPHDKSFAKRVGNRNERVTEPKVEKTDSHLPANFKLSTLTGERDKLFALKQEMHALFSEKDGTPYSGAEIARMSGLNTSDVSIILGKQNKLTPPISISDEKSYENSLSVWREKGKKLAEALHIQTGRKETADRFTPLYEKFLEQAVEVRAYEEAYKNTGIPTGNSR